MYRDIASREVGVNGKWKTSGRTDNGRTDGQRNDWETQCLSPRRMHLVKY